MTEKKGKATVSLVLSVISIAVWLIPLMALLWLRCVQRSMDELH